MSELFGGNGGRMAGLFQTVLERVAAGQTEDEFHLTVEPLPFGVLVRANAHPSHYVMAGIRSLGQKTAKIFVLCHTTGYHRTFLAQDGEPQLEEVVADVIAQAAHMLAALRQAPLSSTAAERFIGAASYADVIEPPAFASPIGDGKVRIFVRWEQDVKLENMLPVMQAIRAGYDVTLALGNSDEVSPE